MSNDASAELFRSQAAQGVVRTTRFEGADFLVIFAFEEQIDLGFGRFLTFKWGADERGWRLGRGCKIGQCCARCYRR